MSTTGELVAARWVRSDADPRQALRRAVKLVLVTTDPLSEAGIVGMLAAHQVSAVPAAHKAQAQAVVAVARTVDGLLLERIRAVAAPSRPVVLVLDDAQGADPQALAALGVRACVARREVGPERLYAEIVAARDPASQPPRPVKEVGLRLARDLERFRPQLPPGARADAAAPSGRELDVLRLIAEGFDTVEIARRMRYSERTVKNILYVMTARLGLRNRAQAVAYALRAGLL